MPLTTAMVVTIDGSDCGAEHEGFVVAPDPDAFDGASTQAVQKVVQNVRAATAARLGQDLDSSASSTQFRGDRRGYRNAANSELERSGAWAKRWRERLKHTQVAPFMSQSRWGDAGRRAAA